ncbi:MAG: outer membrane protein transport protein [Bacteroidetes bacterium]|nr:outer membrane protein transport protein [Bacteroidota bacterium]HET6243525.1 outer membrane protein transport protein [Bacteroidia bacterium]
MISAVSTVKAGGFQVNLQGQKQAGMGHTGTCLTYDASSLFFNPGSISFLKDRYNFSVGGSYIVPSTYYQEKSPGVYNERMVVFPSTPFSVYGTARFLQDKITFGIGVYTPFGSRGIWDDQWKGRFIIQEIALKMIYVQPTLSWKVSDKLAIGGGFIYSFGDFYLRKSLPLQDSEGNYGTAEIKGSGTGYGYSGGIFYKVNEKLAIGLSYRSAVTMNLSQGNAVFEVPSYLEASFPSGNLTGSLKLPGTASAGLSYQYSEKLLLAFDFNYVQWSSYDTLSIDLENNTEKLEDINSPKLFKDSYIIRIGGQYNVSQSLNIRLGTYFDKSPVPDDLLGPETPDMSKLAFTSGMSYLIKKRLSIDLSFLWIEGLKRNFENTETGFAGTFKSRGFVSGIGVSFSF